MKTSIFIASYSKDIPYLRFCLRSIHKFATGFESTVVAVPADEVELFNRLQQEVGFSMMTYDRAKEIVRWHLDAQCQKCMADIYCPTAEFILHTDSDCIFTEPITPEEYFVGGKPVMLIAPYKGLGVDAWKTVVEAVLKRPAEYETMRRHPQVNPIGVYKDLRDHVENLHGMKFRDFVLSRKPDFPWGFTEHNVIGAFALEHPKWKEAYHWIDLSREARPKDKLMQFWSLSPPNLEQALPCGGRGTPLKVIQQILR